MLSVQGSTTSKLLFSPIYFWQFRKAPEGSLRKLTAQKEVVEAMSHRIHIDNSVKLVGKLLFGIEKGPEVLNVVRSAGLPLVDDWDCLKTSVSLPIVNLSFVAVKTFLLFCHI